MKYHSRALLAILVLTVMAIGCANMPGAPQGAKNFTDMTSMEKSVFLMKTYNKQYDSYVQLYEKGNWTDTEKEVLRTKYEALKEVYPFIDMYSGYAESGAVPPESTEQAAIAALNKLLGL